MEGVAFCNHLLNLSALFLLTCRDREFDLRARKRVNWEGENGSIQNHWLLKLTKCKDLP